MGWGKYTNEELGINRNITCSMFESKGITIGRDVECAVKPNMQKIDEEFMGQAFNEVAEKMFGEQVHAYNMKQFQSLIYSRQERLLNKITSGSVKLPPRLTKSGFIDFWFKRYTGKDIQAMQAVVLERLQHWVGVQTRYNSEHGNADEIPPANYNIKAIAKKVLTAIAAEIDSYRPAFQALTKKGATEAAAKKKVDELIKKWQNYDGSCEEVVFWGQQTRADDLISNPKAFFSPDRIRPFLESRIDAAFEHFIKWEVYNGGWGDGVVQPLREWFAKNRKKHLDEMVRDNNLMGLNRSLNRLRHPGRGDARLHKYWRTWILSAERFAKALHLGSGDSRVKEIAQFRKDHPKSFQ